MWSLWRFRSSTPDCLRSLRQSLAQYITRQVICAAKNDNDFRLFRRDYVRPEAPKACGVVCPLSRESVRACREKKPQYFGSVPRISYESP